LPPLPRSARTPRASGPRTLDARALNRALLARQLLLRRSRTAAIAAVEHLVGLQAQNPASPYLALWSRLAGFRPEHIAVPLVERRLVRTATLRGTLHLVSADDCLALRPTVQDVLTRQHASSPAGRDLAGVELEPVLAAARALLDQEPRPGSALGEALARRWPDRDPAALMHAVRAMLPMVQVPPRGVWGQSGMATWAAVETWLGRGHGAGIAVDDLVVRYLAAFGPASVKDAQVWSGLPRLADCFERLRPSLRVFRDAAGGELFDVADGPRPGPDTAAPVRFLPDFDNLLLSHADRSRIVPEPQRPRIASRNGMPPATFLVDGFVAGTWSLVRDGRGGRLVVAPFARLARADRAAVADEARATVAFLAGDGEHGVEILAPA
jgi:hypothetical protein